MAADDRILLKWFLKEKRVKVWAELNYKLNYLRRWSTVGFSQNSDWTFKGQKKQGTNVVHFLCNYIKHIKFNTNLLHDACHLLINAPTRSGLSCRPSSGRS